MHKNKDLRQVAQVFVHATGLSPLRNQYNTGKSKAWNQAGA